MKKSTVSTATQLAASRHLGGLVRTARLARRWTQAELAERARVGLATVKRIEGGSSSPSLGMWLAVFESLSLLHLLQGLEDPISKALLLETQSKRVRHAKPDLDF